MLLAIYAISPTTPTTRAALAFLSVHHCTRFSFRIRPAPGDPNDLRWHEQDCITTLPRLFRLWPSRAWLASLVDLFGSSSAITTVVFPSMVTTTNIAAHHTRFQQHALGLMT